MATTHTTIDTPLLGELTLVAADGALSGLYYPGHWTRPDRAAFGVWSTGGFDEAARHVTEYLAGERTVFEVDTWLAGEPFQRRVWDLLDRIPYGQTTTYGDLARELGDPLLARAVGRAVGANPLSLIIPCHRVVAKDGGLAGYAGGLRRKRALLDLEAPTRAGDDLQLFTSHPSSRV
jgi:methylated-DNA-[protein]-cysteine S-methyltransferase